MGERHGISIIKIALPSDHQSICQAVENTIPLKRAQGNMIILVNTLYTTVGLQLQANEHWTVGHEEMEKVRN